MSHVVLAVLVIFVFATGYIVGYVMGWERRDKEK
jgi:hypothetical protein